MRDHTPLSSVLPRPPEGYLVDGQSVDGPRRDGGIVFQKPLLLELVRAMSRSRWVLFWKIRLPHSLPYLFAGRKIAISFAVIEAIVGEFIPGRTGLGYLVLAANNYFNAPMAFTALVYSVLMSLTLYGLVVLAERLLLPWYHREM